jgi:cytochrome c
MNLRVLIPILLLAGCTASADQSTQAPPATPQSGAPAVLTAAEREAGWELLFDGQTLDGWRGYRSDDLPGRWTVADGAIFYDPSRGGRRGDIITAETYGDFELELEWKIGPCGNSGIMYRVVEADHFRSTFHTGPEMQVLDNTCHPDARNGLDRTAGANYALHAPVKDVTKPAGDWNQVRLILDGARVEHWLNGEKVVEYELWSDDWRRRVADSKFSAWPGYGMGERGHIALQDHNDPVWFRNIRIREL